MTEKLRVSLDMDDLTFGELELFEDVTGLVMSDAVKQEIVIDPKTQRPVPDPSNKGRPLTEAKMSVKAMMGLVYIALKRDNPDLSFQDIRSMKMSDIDFDLEEQLDPTEQPESAEEQKSSEAANE